MKILKKLKFTKKIILIIMIILMLCNFIIPNYSYASSTEGGGSLMDSLSKMLCGIPDMVIEFLQNMFVSNQVIKKTETKYIILYSPGIIFAGEVPAFDINFINPMADKKKDTNYTRSANIEDISEGKIGEAFTRLKKTIPVGAYYADFSQGQSAIDKIYDEYFDMALQQGGREYFLNISDDELKTWYTPPGWLEYRAELLDYLFSNVEVKYYCSSVNGHLCMLIIYEIDFILYKEISYAFFKTELTEEEIEAFSNLGQDDFYANTYYESSAKILQKSVATWYKALRRIALVGLLSVLVYIGIKILLSSTSAKDKAKYKSMLKDWLIALCILFTLHYMMSITITVVDKINGIVKASVIAEDGSDVLMSTIRTEIAKGESWGSVITFVVIYFVLGIYTVIFTVQYIKRTIYLGFLTMIAPLITLTYPLDKIKDGKSQAFDMWLKDYMFFTLIQVVHLLIYYILLGSAINLANMGNWIYAIISIGFLTTAEKIVKKMFGFERSKSMGALAAGATGAFVTNAINSVKEKTGKLGSSTKGNSKQGASNTKVRTVTNSSLSTGQVNPIFSGAEPSHSQDTFGVSGNPGRAEMANTNAQNRGMPSIPINKPKRSIKNGTKALWGRYWRPVVKGVAKGTLGVLAGGTGAMLGFASGVAQGDLGKAASGAFAGVYAGGNLAKGTVELVSGIPSNVRGAVNNVKDTWNEGAYGKEFAESASKAREFKRSSVYRDLRRDYEEILSDDKIRAMLDANITDTKTMKKILENHKKHPRKYSLDKAIAYSELAKVCPEEILHNNVKFLRFCQDRKINIKEEELEKLRNCILDFK